jgi:hypothetical protein
MLKITRYFTQYSKTYSINLREHGLGEITISRHTNVDGTEWKPATVNWAGCGDQARHLTERFINALNIAAYLCGTLNTGEAVTEPYILNSIQDEIVPVK